MALGKFKRGGRYKRMLRNMSRKRRPQFRSTQIPGNIMKYISKGAYGQETKTADWTFNPNWLKTAQYPPDLAGVYFGLNISGNTNTTQALNLITQGPGVMQRIGNKISLKSLRLRLTLQDTSLQPAAVVVGANTSAPVPFASLSMAFPTTARLGLVYDRQPSSQTTYPVVYPGILGAIQQDSTTTVTEPYYNVFANIDVNSLERFTMLMDKTLVLPGKAENLAPTNEAVGVQTGPVAPQVGPTSFKEPYLIDEFIKLRDLETVFNTTAANATIAFVVTGSLILFSLGSEAMATEPWFWGGMARVRFHDN